MNFSKLAKPRRIVAERILFGLGLPTIAAALGCQSTPIPPGSIQYPGAAQVQGQPMAGQGPFQQFQPPNSKFGNNINTVFGQFQRNPGGTTNPAAGQPAGQSVQQMAENSFQSKPSLEQEFNVHMDLGQTYEVQGAHDAAASEYRQALEVASRPAKRFSRVGKIDNERKADAHSRLAGSLDRLGVFPQSESQYREALALSPNNVNIWNNVGYSYYLQGRWAESEQALRNAVRLAPKDTRALTNLGLTLAASGKTQEAFGALAQVVGPAGAHANLGFILASNNQVAEARQHYQAAIQMQPDYAPFQTALAQLNASTNATTVAASPSSGPPQNQIQNQNQNQNQIPTQAQPAQLIAGRSATSVMDPNNNVRRELPPLGVALTQAPAPLASPPPINLAQTQGVWPSNGPLFQNSGWQPPPANLGAPQDSDIARASAVSGVPMPKALDYSPRPN